MIKCSLLPDRAVSACRSADVDRQRAERGDRRLENLRAVLYPCTGVRQRLHPTVTLPENAEQSLRDAGMQDGQIEALRAKLVG